MPGAEAPSWFGCAPNGDKERYRVTRERAARMSESQYYEFLAVDRTLTERELGVRVK